MLLSGARVVRARVVRASLHRCWAVAAQVAREPPPSSPSHRRYSPCSTPAASNTRPATKSTRSWMWVAPRRTPARRAARWRPRRPGRPDDAASARSTGSRGRRRRACALLERHTRRALQQILRQPQGDSGHAGRRGRHDQHALGGVRARGRPRRQVTGAPVPYVLDAHVEGAGLAVRATRQPFPQVVLPVGVPEGRPVSSSSVSREARETTRSTLSPPPGAPAARRRRTAYRRHPTPHDPRPALRLSWLHDVEGIRRLSGFRP